MGNYIVNYLKFKTQQDFEKALPFVMPNGTIDADKLVPMPDKQRDILKEIMDGTADWENEDLKYLFKSQHSIHDVWKKIYWGAIWLHETNIFYDKNAICFETVNTAPVGVVKALHDLKIKFEYIYKNEGYDKYNYVNFKNQFEVHDDFLPKIEMIIDNDFLRDTYKEFVEFMGGEEELKKYF